MNPDIEKHLDTVFEESAKEDKRQYSGKTWNYHIDDRFDLNSKGLVKNGKCAVLDVSYDKHEDCKFITIRDINTNETFTINEFCISLKKD